MFYSLKKKSKFPTLKVFLLFLIGFSVLLDSQPNKTSSQKKSLVPKVLTKAKKIALISTAFYIPESKRVSAVKRLQALGYKTIEAKNIKSKSGYLAGTEDERLSAFHELLKQDDVGAIFHVRGGFGNAHLLDKLDYDEIKKQRKIIMGYSDVTAMLLAIYKKTGLITYHGPMPKTGISRLEAGYIEQVLTKQQPIIYENPKNKPIRTLVAGKASGILVGGNLSVICSMLGSDYLPDWRGKILFLEDVGEKIYKIDRLLSQLKLAGVLDEVSGIVLGAFNAMTSVDSDSFSLEEVFERYFSKLKIPIYAGAQFGHISDQFILPVGAKALIDSKKGTLEIFSYENSLK